jgi:hypothetical protein
LEPFGFEAGLVNIRDIENGKVSSWRAVKLYEKDSNKGLAVQF